jgi:hypothetical protein
MRQTPKNRLCQFCPYVCMLAIVLLLFLPNDVMAQEPPALIVNLHDVAGAPVVGATITIVDRGGTRVLGRGTTDSEGSALFPPLPTSEVRVVVSGQLPTGTPLRLVGDDAAGIALTLGRPGLTLELRSEADGTVIPDPASLALEPGPLLVATLAPIAPSPRPTLALDPAVPPAPVPPTFAVDPPEPLSNFWPGLLLLVLLLVALLVVVLFQSRWRRSP